MKYYKIEHSLNEKIVGTFGQILDCKVPDDWETNPNFTANISFKEFNDAVISPIAILHKKAKLTDLLSTIPAGFTPKLLTSTALKDIILSFDKGLFQAFPCDVLVGNLTYQYWLASPLKTHWDFVDFKRTETLIRRKKAGGGTYLTVLPIDSLESFNQLLENTAPDERWHITVDKINVLPDVNEDIFVLDKVYGGVGYYVSERLKNAIEFHEISGIEFKPIYLNFHEWHHTSREAIYGKV